MPSISLEKVFKLIKLDTDTLLTYSKQQDSMAIDEFMEIVETHNFKTTEIFIDFIELVETAFAGNFVKENMTFTKFHYKQIIANKTLTDDMKLYVRLKL